MTYRLCRFSQPRRVCGVVFALLLTSLPTAGQVITSQVTNVAPTSGRGVIRGRVVNESGQAMPNAIVMISRLDSPRMDQSTMTDREGKFELSGLEPVLYRMSAHFPAYTPSLSDVNENEAKYRVGDTVTLTLIKGGVITGTVTNQAGEPVVGVTVRARVARDAERLLWPHQMLQAERRTDDRGIYRIYGLPSGTYVVAAGGPGMGAPNTDPFYHHAPTYAPDSTRDTAIEVTVRAGEETDNIDIRYRADLGHVVSGKIRPTKGAEGLQYGVNLSLVKDGDFRWEPAYNLGFEFNGVGDGEYYVNGFAGDPGGQVMFATPKRIRVEGADVTGVELIIEPMSTVSGRVVLRESKASECTDKERPLFSETLISARAKNESLSPSPFFLPIVSPNTVDAEGKFLLKNVLPGQYYFGAQFSGKYWYLESITLPGPTTPAARASRPLDATRAWTTLKPGDRLSGLTITLAQGAASVQGKVLVREGETWPEGSSVYLVPAEREEAENVLRYFVAAVKLDGKIALNNIAPGRYWVLLSTNRSSLTKLRKPDQTNLRSTLRREAEAAKTEIEFKPCQNVVGFELRLI